MVLYVGIPSMRVNVGFGKDSMYVSGVDEVIFVIGWAVLVGRRGFLCLLELTSTVK